MHAEEQNKSPRYELAQAQIHAIRTALYITGFTGLHDKLIKTKASSYQLHFTITTCYTACALKLDQ